MGELDLKFSSLKGISDQRVTYHSACSMQHGQGIHNQPLKLLSAAGFDVKEPLESHLCCGSAGTYNILQKEMADNLGDRNPANQPGFAERQAARRAASIAREERLKERKAAKEAEKIRKSEEEAAKKLAKEIALKAEQERLEAEAIKREEAEAAHAAERKAERDRKYAARKARKRK